MDVEDDICRYCRKPGTDDVCFSYWKAFRYPCHKLCKKEGARKEAYDCQLIDADCNDCKNFKRGESKQIQGTSVKWFEGDCSKFNRPTKAFANHASSHACFEHRKEKSVT